MIKRDNLSLILAEFFREPNPEIGGFHLRELSRKVNFAPTSVKKYLDELEKNELITIKNHPLHNYPLYKANIKSDYFKYLKKLFLLQELKETGLISFFEEQFSPITMVLFGKASRGEDLSKEEIDLLILVNDSKGKSSIQEISEEIKNLESKLNRRLALIITSDFNELNHKLKNSIINGIVLSGSLEVFFPEPEQIKQKAIIKDSEEPDELEDEEQDETEKEIEPEKPVQKEAKKTGFFSILKRKNYHKVRQEDIEKQERTSIKEAIQTKQAKDKETDESDEEFYSSSLDIDEI